MSNAATRDLLGSLHALVAEELIAKIKSGEASTADLSTAIKFLKDNGIEAVTANDTRLSDLARSLPDFGDDLESENVDYGAMN